METIILGSLLGANTVLSASGAYAQSRAAQNQANYQAQVAQRNADIAVQDATAIGQRSAVAELDHRRRIALAKSTYSAHASGRGIAASSGSVMDALGDIGAEGAFDIMKIRDDAALKQRNAMIRGHGYQASAGLYTQRARGFNPLFDAGSTLIGAGTKSFGNYYAVKSLIG